MKMKWLLMLGIFLVAIAPVGAQSFMFTNLDTAHADGGYMTTATVQNDITSSVTGTIYASIPDSDARSLMQRLPDLGPAHKETALMIIDGAPSDAEYVRVAFYSPKGERVRYIPTNIY